MLGAGRDQARQRPRRCRCDTPRRGKFAVIEQRSLELHYLQHFGKDIHTRLRQHCGVIVTLQALGSSSYAICCGQEKLECGESKRTERHSCPSTMSKITPAISPRFITPDNSIT